MSVEPRRGRISLSVAFQSNKSPAEYRALAELADRYAFDVVSVYNDLLYQPALGPLLWMAPALQHARLGPAALNPYTTHPLEIAGQVARSGRFKGSGGGAGIQLLRRLATARGADEADLLSYILFDGLDAAEVARMGYEDARSHHDELARFLGDAVVRE